MFLSIREALSIEIALLWSHIIEHKNRSIIIK